MRFLPKNISIEEEGLENYLNRTKEQHRGHGYGKFLEMLNDEKQYTMKQIAIEFGVDRTTIYKWRNFVKKLITHDI